MTNKFVAIAAVAVLTGLLGACGVKSSPTSPASNEFPKIYPKPEQGAAPSGKIKPATSSDSFYQYPNQPPQ